MIAPRPETKVRELVEEGNHVATLYRIIYIGTVEGEYKGEPNSSYKVDLTWELNNEMKVWKEGEVAKPIVLSKSYTLSMAPKSNLLPIVEGIVGGLSQEEADYFDLDDLLGKVCLLNVIHGVSEKTGKKYENVSTSKIMKGIPAPSPFNKQAILSYQDWNEEMFKALPQWMREKMETTPEYKKMKKGSYAEGPETVDIKVPPMDVQLESYTEELDPADIPF